MRQGHTFNQWQSWGLSPDAWTLRPEPESHSLCSAASRSRFTNLKPRQCSLALSNPKVRGTSVLSLLHNVQGCLCREGKGSRDFTSRRDLGSSPELGCTSAKVPGMQLAGKGYPSHDHVLDHSAHERAGSPIPRWSPDGFSLKTCPENLEDPGKLGLEHCSSPASREQASLWLPCDVPSKSLLCFSSVFLHL